MSALQLDGQDSATVCAIGGLAGVGKSALAVHAARSALQAGWFDGAVWVNLRGFDPEIPPMEIASTVTVLLRALGVAEEEIPPGTEEQLAVYHGALAEMAARGQHVLVVLDNAADASQVQRLLPGDSVHRAMVTSRRALVSLGARLVDLDVLDETRAVSLLATALRDARHSDPRARDEDALVPHQATFAPSVW
ncbi:hypothetical protein KDK95_33660 [Actinospica sp. MGRD01-02]|uniref:NB-ARC domain-containing protein n=2 Tax=Actinospica acidithermotolerans TaxID=2828514 RepID=A0A941IJZ6_9ACTN|nr:hypothetical protein [Actinospica acidithermotolerans]